MEGNYNLLTLYNHLVHTRIPAYCTFFKLLENHYFDYKCFYYTLLGTKIKHIDKIEYNPENNDALSIKISLLKDKADKFIEDINDNFIDEIDGNKFELSIEKLTDSEINVLIKGMKEDDFYEFRISKYTGYRRTK